MLTLLNQAVTTTTPTRSVRIEPCKSVVVSASTADLANGTLFIEWSTNDTTWSRAYDIAGVIVPTLVGTAGAVLLAAKEIKNESKGPLFLRGRVLNSGTLAGTVTVNFVTADGALLDDAGVGITNSVGAVYRTAVERVGNFIRTTILIDLTGMNCGGTADDIIGKDAAGAAHLGQLKSEVNGDIFAGIMFCSEVPVTGNADVDLWSANENTGIEDSAVSALTGELQLVNNGAHTLARASALIVMPLDGQYLYLTCGTSTAGTYTAGIFVITLYGLPKE